MIKGIANRLGKYGLLFIVFIVFCVLLIPGCAKKAAKEAKLEEFPESEQKILSFNLANYADDGIKKWDLKGESADILSEIIYLTNIMATTYDEPQMKLMSKDGSYNKKTRIVSLANDVALTTSEGLRLDTDTVEWNGATDVISTDDPVSIKRSDVVATGLGAEALPQMKKVMLIKDVSVVLTRDAMGGVPLEEFNNGPEKNQEEGDKQPYKVSITCDGPLEIDYENNIAVFRNNVKVDDQRGQIYAALMEAYLDPDSKSITKVIAKGGVRVVRGEDSTYSEKAIYTTADQKIVLLGQPEVIIHADKEIGSFEQEFDKVKR